MYAMGGTNSNGSSVTAYKYEYSGVYRLPGPDPELILYAFGGAILVTLLVLPVWRRRRRKPPPAQ